MSCSVLPVLLGVVLLGPVVLGCDRTPEKDRGSNLPAWKDIPESSASGPRFEDEDFVLEVKEPHYCNLDSPLAPPNGQRRLSVPLKLTAKSDRPVPISALTFSLEDEQGHVFRATLAGCAPALKQQTLKQGKTIEGEVAFDVPDNVGAVQMLFEPFLMGRKGVRARVEVPPPPVSPSGTH